MTSTLSQDHYDADNEYDFFLACPSLSKLPRTGTDGADYVLALRAKEVHHQKEKAEGGDTWRRLTEKEYIDHHGRPLPGNGGGGGIDYRARPFIYF